MEETSKLEIAKLTQFNEKAEAQAVFDYTEMINQVLKSDLTEEEKQFVITTIEELISDELNHQQKLQMLYVFLTSIQPNKD